MNKKIGLGIGLVTLVLLLAGGAFTAVQLLTAQGNLDAPAGSVVFERVMDDGGGGHISVTTIIEPSPDLPQDQAAVEGLFIEEKDGSHFIGTGEITIAQKEGESAVATDYSGPKVEVVVRHDTIFYQDVTKIDPHPTESGVQRYVQEVRQIEAPAQIADTANLTVWGDKNGDRVVAKIIVIRGQQ